MGRTCKTTLHFKSSEMTPRDLQSALRLLGKLAFPTGDWRDDEARRLARKLLKKIGHGKRNDKDI